MIYLIVGLFVIGFIVGLLIGGSVPGVVVSALLIFAGAVLTAVSTGGNWALLGPLVLAVGIGVIVGMIARKLGLTLPFKKGGVPQGAPPDTGSSQPDPAPNDDERLPDE